jgi:peptide deformylase
MWTKLVPAAELPLSPVEKIRIPLDNQELLSALEAMKSLVQEKSGIAIAGPQIGYNKSVFVVKKPESHKEWDICVNPVITPFTDRGQTSATEGCLSYPGKLFLINRWLFIRFVWQQLIFKEEKIEGCNFVIKELQGGWARVAQHEVDHLEGRLIPQQGEVVDAFSDVIEAGCKAGLYLDKKTNLLWVKQSDGRVIPLDLPSVSNIKSSYSHELKELSRLRKQRERRVEQKKERRRQRRLH